MTLSPDPSTLRAFIAIEIPEELRRAILRTRDKLRMTDAHVSWVPDPNLHLTLVFLGDISTDTADLLSAALKKGLRNTCPFRVDVQGVGAFGRPGAPRIVWAGTDNAEPVTALYDSIAANVRELGIPVEDRPFHPHITMGRVRSSRGRKALVEAMANHADTTFGSMEVYGVALMRSILKLKGVAYERLHEARFVSQD